MSPANLTLVVGAGCSRQRDREPAGASFAALGTTAMVLVSEPGALESAFEAVRSVVDAMDKAASRFRADSDLSAVNRGAGRPVEVGPLLVDAVETALRAARLTAGLVDPTVGESLRVIGYDRSFSDVARCGAALNVQVRPVPGWRMVWCDRASSCVRIPEKVLLDLGATAKALCADRAAAAAAARCGGGVLVSLGGDMAAAGPAPAAGWQVRVTDRHDSPRGAPGQTVALGSGGLATSGTAARRWRRGGLEFHHLVDPTTGLPATEHWRTVSVAAASCVDANIASTASMILGAGAAGWLEERKLPARLVTPAGAVVTVSGWPEDTPRGPAPARSRRRAAGTSDPSPPEPLVPLSAS